LLDRLAKSGRHFASIQSAEHIDIDQNSSRLVERADEILPEGRIDPRLAADRRIDHRKQRRGDL
jgi:hypothetical protein